MRVNIKKFIMNKVKSVLALALIFTMTVPCFGNSVMIKRKKNKWNYSLEQKALDNTNNSLETAKFV